MKRILATGLATGLYLAGVIAGTAAAQPVPGHAYLLTSSTGLYAIDHATRQLTTLVSTPKSQTRFNEITMNTGNTAAAMSFYGVAGPQVLSWAPQTGLTSIVGAMPSAPGPLDVDQDGRLLICGSPNVLYKTQGLLNNSVATISSGFPGSGVSALCIDDDTGDYFVAITNVSQTDRHVLHIDRRNGAFSTFIANSGLIRALAHDQATGRFIAIASDAPELRVYDRAGRMIASRVLDTASGLDQDDVTGHIHVATGDSVFVFDRTLAQLDRYGPYPQVFFTDLVVWGGRTVGPASSIIHSGGKRGAKYAIQGRFPDSPNCAYACGINVSGLRPGIPMRDGRTINIAPDALFFATVAGSVPLYTSRFVGMTDANGAFQASFIVPMLSTTASLVCATAGVVNPQAPSGLDLGRTIAIRVLP